MQLFTPESSMRRTLDATFLNEVANHPDVRPWLGGEGKLDLSAQIGNVANIALVAEGGGYVLIQLEPGLYEVHSLFLPEAHKRSVSAMRDGLDYMFTRTPCERIVTQSPDNNPAAKALSKLAHFRPVFRSEFGGLGPTTFMTLDIEDWAMGNQRLDIHGAWFHAKIEEAKAACSSPLPPHPDDPAHERAVGAAVAMVRVGNAAKGVGFYNRWARLARYPQIQLLSQQPLLFDVGEGMIVSFEDGDMEILTCP